MDAPRTRVHCPSCGLSHLVRDDLLILGSECGECAHRNPMDEAFAYARTFGFGSPEYCAVIGLIEELQFEHRVFSDAERARESRQLPARAAVGGER